MKRLLRIYILLILFIFSSLPINSSSALVATENAVLYDEIEKIGLSTGYTTRELLDFSGNKYILIECENTGYAIYHPIAKVFSEFSTESKSPYLRHQNIVYGGPMSYYSKNNTIYTNLLTGESTTVSEKSYHETTEKDTLSLIYHNFISEKQNTRTRIADTVYLLPNAYYFQKLTAFGYNQLGTCGQLAASIMLSYYANFINVNFVPTNYITPASNTNTNFQSWESMPELSDALHQELISITRDLDLSLGTTGTSIKSILSEYYSRHTIGGVSQSVLTSPFFIDSQMRDIIDSNNPMIMFGYLSLPNGTRGDHAVVCYGYRIQSNVTYYQVHMGYSGYPAVNLANLWSQNIFGQIYSINYTGNHFHSGNFIVNGVAYCGCGNICI